MPRDLELEQEQATTEETSPKVTPFSLTESPNSLATERLESPTQQDDGSPPPSQNRFVIIPEDQHYSKAPTTKLHPYTRPLTISDLDSCEALENAAFTDSNERATREKIRYRLTKCGELCLGIFCTVIPSSGISAETLATGRPVETSRPNATSVLLGHIIAAKTDDLVASDDSMGVPKDWDSQDPVPTNIGHQEAGRTIIMHSVAILPGFQGRGIGRILMMAYMQQMNGAGIADRLALIAHDHKVGWYSKLGFSKKGKSEAKFGGGGWYDLVFQLKTPEMRTAFG